MFKIKLKWRSLHSEGYILLGKIYLHIYAIKKKAQGERIWKRIFSE